MYILHRLLTLWTPSNFDDPIALVKALHTWINTGGIDSKIAGAPVDDVAAAAAAAMMNLQSISVLYYTALNHESAILTSKPMFTFTLFM